MHFEIFVEDSSGVELLSHLLPKILGENGDHHSWRTHRYKGVGRLPQGLTPKSDPSKRILLDQLPRILRGFSKAHSIDYIVVVLDVDNRDCHSFLAELKELARECGVESKTLFRLAIEEVESWYFGDREALLEAYPRANGRVLNDYVQDSVCGTWERFADAVHPGGAAAIKSKGWPAPGELKHEWAGNIGPRMEPDRNKSPSFIKLRDGLRRALDAAK